MDGNRLIRIVKTSIVGIVVNILLGVIKLSVGMASNSIAIMSDAVNNFSDSISSIVTIITTRLAGKPPTKKHPFGYGRVEYFSGAIISAIVLVTGTEFFISSVKKIINPTESTYGIIAIVMLVVAIIAKIVLGLYTKNVGEKEDAPSLIASGQDAMSDSILTGVTLIGAIITISFNVNIDGWLGVIVSIFVLKAGVEILWDIISKLLGEREDVELAQKIVKEVGKYDGILGVYDLILHNYGPNIHIGEVYVELNEHMSVREAYNLLNPIRSEIFQKHGVLLYIGIYAVNTTDEHVMKISDRVKEIVMQNEYVLQVHAFSLYENDKEKAMTFDVVMDFDCYDNKKLKQEILHSLEPEFSEYKKRITVERDFSLSE